MGPPISINGIQTVVKEMDANDKDLSAEDPRKIIDIWYPKKPDPVFTKREWRTLAEKLHDDIRKRIRASFEKSMPPATIQTKLVDCLTDNRMHIYLKLYMLHECVDSSAEDDESAPCLTRALLENTPFLSLAAANFRWDLLPSDAQKHLITMPPPLFQAATDGKTRIFKAMLEQESKAPKETVLKRLKKPDGSSNTVFSIAVRNDQWEIVRILLDYNTGIASDASPILSKIDEVIRNVEEGNDPEPQIRVIAEVLKFRKDFRTAETLMKALRSGNEKLVNLFMDDSCPFDDFVAKKIIKLDYRRIWEFDSVKKRCEELKTKGLLHHAVQHQRLWFVELFLRDNPKLVKEEASLDIEFNKEEKFPLWHNNHVITSGQKQPRNDSDGEKGEIRKKIRNLLVSAMIKTQKMDVISEIFSASKENAGEVCFDLSRFDSESFPVRDFVNSLTKIFDQAGIVSFEPVLRYADFPSLDLSSEVGSGQDLQKDHTEVFDVLDWLSEKKSVREIVELNVLDRLHNPHNEIKIGQLVDRLKVEVLNWRCLDLPLSVFEKETKERIRELHLYTSGKRAVIGHWISSQGVDTFPNLRKLYVHVIQDIMSTKRAADIEKYAKKAFEPYGEKASKNCWFPPKVQARWWNQRLPIENMKNLSEVAEAAVPKLLPFINLYKDLIRIRKNSGPHPRSIKVALIDNGILNISPHNSKGSKNGGLWHRIKEGRTFVDQGYKASPWLFASDPHGTQMANLICAIDPNCHLYVAKVSEGQFGIFPSRVRKAIEWAIDRQVDIISMSFAIQEDDEKLKNIVRDASDNGILLLCSTHDVGSNVRNAWPARCQETITVAACNEFGGLLHRVPPEESGYEYKIHGEDVSAGVVPFLNSADKISGSSVATAIAAGLSSLILSCDYLQNPDRAHDKESKKDMVKYHLDKMSVDPNNPKYVPLEHFCKMHERGQVLDINQVLKESFDPNANKKLTNSGGSRSFKMPDKRST